MRITMLQSHSDSLDGVSTSRLEEGETYDLPNDVAGRILSMGIAIMAPEVKDAGDAEENKDAGDAEENKAPATAPRRRRRAAGR